MKQTINDTERTVLYARWAAYRREYYSLYPLSLLLVATWLLSACASPGQISYFQDLRPGESEQKISFVNDIRIRPEDKISILVNSKDQMLANLFNLPIASRHVGQPSGNSTGTVQGLSGYTTDADGNIDFPVLGSINVAGKKREEIASYIKNELINRNLVKDPVVTVEFMNLSISVMGEVNRPGRYNIDKDKVSLPDALSMAGDLTIYGKREKILVLRQEKGVQQVYGIDLCSANDLYGSPAYYLQQNDVVYVEPNATKARQSTVNGNNIRSTSFWISLASLLTSIGILVFR